MAQLISKKIQLALTCESIEKNASFMLIGIGDGRTNSFTIENPKTLPKDDYTSMIKAFDSFLKHVGTGILREN